jgi:Flp pilus assembly pilin Flp
MKRLQNSWMRKVLCRVMGDKTGGVMMEYVILAVLIAAAVVVAVAMFGKTLVGMFGVAATSATAREKSAQTELKDVRKTTDAGIKDAKKYSDDMHEPTTGP